MVLDISGIEYPWFKHLDRATFLLGALGSMEASRILADARDWVAFCDAHRLLLDAGEVEELKALYRV